MHAEVSAGHVLAGRDTMGSGRNTWPEEATKWKSFLKKLDLRGDYPTALYYEDFLLEVKKTPKSLSPRIRRLLS